MHSRFTCVLLLATALMTFGGAAGGQGPTVAVSGRSWSPLPAGWVEGYARTLHGVRFDYHSAHPRLRQSLLVRSQDSTLYAEWNTDAPQRAVGSGAITYAWLASMDVADPGQAPVRFLVSINGVQRLILPQPASTEPATWTVRGDSDVSLEFRRLLVDKFGDVSGLMLLRVPASSVHPGQPLRVRVQGENVGRQSWFILFTGPVASHVWAESEQALVRTTHGAEQSIRLDAWMLADTAHVDVRVAGGAATHVLLPPGASTVRVGTRRVTRQTTVTLEVTDGTRRLLWPRFAVAPVVRRTVYLIPHAHLDIGYTDLQQHVERRHWATYDSALAVIERTRDYPEESQFRWNVEGLWPVESYLDSAPASERDRFLSAARAGRISLNGFYANLLTGLLRPEAMARALAFADTLRTRDHVPITTATSSDIPGFAWGVVPALAQRGIRYLSSGPNYQPSLPGRGDRIGHTLERLGDRPFWWIGESGHDSILVWLAGRGYSWFHGFTAGRLTLAEADRMLEYMQALKAAKYPYELVQVRYTIGGDNGIPDARLPDVVREWNARFESPRLVISTLPTLFAEFERRYGADIPRLRGDFTGYWEDGAASSARELGIALASGERLAQAEQIAAMRKVQLPAGALHDAWQKVILFTEHTWGADRSVSDPDLPDVQAQWRWKQRLAIDADSVSASVLQHAVRGLSTGPTDIVVVNSTSYRRSEVVALPPENSPNDNALRSQVLHSGMLAARVEVAPHGALHLTSDAIGGMPSPSAAVHASADSLWNGSIVVHVDSRSGALRSLRYRGVELVDATGGGLAQYWYVAGRSSSGATTVSDARLTVTDSGPLVATIVARAHGPGIDSLVVTYRLTAGSDRVDVELAVDKLAIREKEGVHIGFPLRIPRAQVRFDTGNGFYRPDVDQLPGANHNVFTAQRWADVSNTSLGVTIATVDAPLMEIGGMSAEDWHRSDGRETWQQQTPRSSWLYSYVMNNYWHTNYRADQSGRVAFRYTILPHQAFDAAESHRLGVDVAQPLLVVRGITVLPR